MEMERECAKFQDILSCNSLFIAMYIVTIGVASLATEVMLVINRRRNPLCTIWLFSLVG